MGKSKLQKLEEELDFVLNAEKELLLNKVEQYPERLGEWLEEDAFIKFAIFIIWAKRFSKLEMEKKRK